MGQWNIFLEPGRNVLPSNPPNIRKRKTIKYDNYKKLTHCIDKYYPKSYN